MQWYARAVAMTAAWSTPRRARIYPSTVAVCTTVLWTASQIVGPGLADASKVILGADFAAFYNAGRFLLEGRLAELYDFRAQRAFQQALAAPVQTDGFSPFINPPFAATIFAPFAVSSYVVGLIAWWAFGLALFAGSMVLLRRCLAPTSESLTRWLFAAAVFFPTLAWFFYGQATPLTLALYTLTFVLLRQGRDVAGGVALGLVLYKPQLGLALALALLVQQRWRALAGACIGALCWVSVGFAMGADVMREYLALGPALFTLLRSGLDPRFDLSAAYPTWGLHSLFGFSALLLDGLSTRAANLLAGALMLAGASAVIMWWRRTPWEPGSRAWDLTWAATAALGLLVSPHLFVYDLMLLLLPLVIVVSRFPHGHDGRHLDGGPLLAWTTWLYVATYFGSYVTFAQLWVSQALGWPAVALQVSVPVIAGWAWTVARTAQHTRE